MTKHKLLPAWAKRSGAASAGVVAVLMLSACAGNAPADPGPESSPPTASATASPAPTPTPTPSAVYKPADASGPAQNVPVPVLPEVAKTETKEGLEAFAKHWFSVLSYSYETGELAVFESIEPQSCAACQKVKEVIADWHSEGRWLVGGQLTTPVADTTFVKDPEGRYKVAVQVHQVPLTYMRADGTVARTDPQTPDQGNLLILKFEDNGWSVSELGSIVG
ncbi:hypothetical protein D7Z96_04565 [Pseudarthrobacter phenanthrenivorans]|uniref:DUF6318 domain-containing protein n=1 Tax=Pseudarthrobacter phenanthrenivorans TaxID=361575 RepID=A0A3B0G2J2_PSEPS|nr:DUF6318 family protein [Pseudarthrobacter phenanthrenivorans]RKO26029.1 hypothetical protein D7Z96_04565 [Pseudarthrobacter phenanthrenivorans]